MICVDSSQRENPFPENTPAHTCAHADTDDGQLRELLEAWRGRGRSAPRLSAWMLVHRACACFFQKFDFISALSPPVFPPLAQKQASSDLRGVGHLRCTKESQKVYSYVASLRCAE